MGIRYAINNLINSNTLDSVSTEDALYVKEWMYNERQSKPFRMTAKTGNIVFDLAAGRPDIIGIMNHNLTNAATITLEFANDPPNWGAPDDSIVLTWNELNIWESFTKDYRWLRLVLADAGNPYNLSFGEVILTTSGTFTRNYNWGSSDVLRFFKSDRVTGYGQRHRSLLAKGRAFNLRFENITDAHLVSEVEAFFDAFNGVDPFIFIPDDSEANCWYVYCLNDLEAVRNFIDINSFALSLEEQTRGIALL